jgi:putative ABC transport system substrate-binding protein
MNRRAFIGRMALGVVAVPVAVDAQQPAKVARIGYLATGPLESPEQRSVFDAFRQGMRELGYVEGRNIVIVVREADGKIERFPALARELVGLKVDVIVATNSLTGRAVRRATSTIPTVVPIMGDPVGDGLVASLARPGGNITGLAFIGPQLVPKRLELLKEALPNVSRVAGLWHPGGYGERTMNGMMKEAEGAAQTLRLQLRLVAVQRPDELGRAFATIAGDRADALFVFPSPMLFTERRRIVELAAKQRLPSMSQDRAFVEIGGLLSYGANITALSRRGAAYVDKILKGAKPADLPVQQPTKFELVINLKTARALGLTIPSSLLLRADEVIQ